MIRRMERLSEAVTRRTSEASDGFRQLRTAGLRSFESASILTDTAAIPEGFELRQGNNGKFYAKHMVCGRTLSIGPMTGFKRLTNEMTNHAQRCEVPEDLHETPSLELGLS